MPRTFPSQIIDFLTHHFADKLSLTSREKAGNVSQEKVGTIAAFVDLYDDLPPELIRLPADQYATLIAAMGTIRLGIDQWRQTREMPSLAGVAPAVQRAWEIIETLSGSVPSNAHDLAFVTDPWAEIARPGLDRWCRSLLAGRTVGLLSVRHAPDEHKAG